MTKTTRKPFAHLAAAFVAVAACALYTAPASAAIFLKIPSIADPTAPKPNHGVLASEFDWMPTSIDETGRFMPGTVRLVFEDTEGEEFAYLAQAAAQGRTFDEIVIQARKDPGDARLASRPVQAGHVTYQLQQCQVVSWSTALGANGEPALEVVLSFEYAQVDRS